MCGIKTCCLIVLSLIIAALVITIIAITTSSYLASNLFHKIIHSAFNTTRNVTSFEEFTQVIKDQFGIDI
jgi:hypothetical protein